MKKKRTVLATRLNSAQQEYLHAMLASFDHQPVAPTSITVGLDPTHETGDDHGQLVIESDYGTLGWHIDAFLADTSRPSWY